MKEIIKFLKYHQWGFLLALTVAFILVFPQIYFRYDAKDFYRGIDLTPAPIDEYFYQMRFREVLDGHPMLASTPFQDGKDSPYLQPPLGEILVAFVGRIFSSDFNNALLAARFFFAFLNALVIYFFVFFISRQRLAALTATVFLFLGSTLLSRSGFLDIISGQSPRGAFIIFGRFLHPQVSSLFFFAFLLFFWFFYEKRRWFFGIIASLLLGLSFYVYFYTWSFLYAFLALIFLVLVIQKDWKTAKWVLYIAISAFVIALPYFLNTYQGFLSPNYQDVSPRFGLLHTREPILGFVAPLLIVLAVFFFPRQQKERYLFILSLAIAPILVLNQQVISGFSLMPVHYHWYFNTPLLALFLTMVIFHWLYSRRNLKIILASLIMGLSFYTGLTIQKVSYEGSKEATIELQRYGPVLEWLNQNAAKEEVAFVDPSFSHYVLIYTPLNVFYDNSAGYYLTSSRQRMSEMLFTIFRLEGLKGEEAKELFLKNKSRRLILAQNFFNQYYRVKFGEYDAAPDEVFLSFAEDYRNFVKVPLEKVFKWHKVKYFIWDTKKYPQWGVQVFDFLKETGRIGDFIIYQVI